MPRGRALSDRLLAQAGREYGERTRALALLVLAPVILLLLPLLVVSLGARLDAAAGWSAFLAPPASVVLGLLLAVPSWIFGAWAVHRQFTLGRGTPVPVMATQVLVVVPPYTYCRNPMALGAIGMYLGVAVMAGSPGALLVVLALAGLLLAYIRSVEEREMVARFGAEYRAYRQRTPFLVPRLRRRA
jgi:protein-S-isoprenylcysteine O-methyltransferase Ste14